jgi:2-polyprenyl-3-methyl-5-hydroxy-6-metoxy-1,4-benzoquinol methylase
MILKECPDADRDVRLETVRKSLIENCFADQDYLASESGQNDLAAHLYRRLEFNRARVIPWMESFLPLAGARVLEIGCGTGSSTLALVERGAQVTAMDISSAGIRVARERCHAYGHQATFFVANAASVKKAVPSTTFDAIIFYASLEHMIHEERRQAMRDTWDMLSPGAYWMILDTPNRLWYYDHHTALLPFYNWLPDIVAFEYSRFSGRDYFRDSFLHHNPKSELDFLRRGRGLSFHEFELFMAPRQQLEVVSCLHTHFRAIHRVERLRWSASNARAYVGFLQRVCPDLDEAFLQPSLDLAIRKSNSHPASLG